VTSLSSNSLCHYDKTSLLLKSYTDCISFPLSYLFHQSVAIEVFPEWLKYLKIKSLCKKGEELCISSHRLISILTECSKIFEKFIFQRVSDLSLSNIRVSEQFVFRRSLLSDYALFSFTEEILSAFVSKMHVGGISYDWQLKYFISERESSEQKGIYVHKRIISIMAGTKTRACCRE
jgi:hypothetical protein